MRVRGRGLKRTVELLEAAEPHRDTSRSTGTRKPTRMMQNVLLNVLREEKAVSEHKEEV